MTSEEEKQILARISQLAGQINRHKNQQAGIQSIPSHHPSHHRQNAFRSPGHGGGYRVGRPPGQYRNRTLVMKSGTQTPNSSGSDTPGAPEPSTTWVSRNEGSTRQLINSSIYEKDAQARAKAIAETRQKQLLQRDEREKAKLKAFLLSQRGPTAVAPADSRSRYEIDIQGIRFRVAQNGSKLIKLDAQPVDATPKTAVVGGVKFFRSKNGNLYRHGIVRAQRKSGVVKKVDEPCKIFSTSGSCPKGPACRYVHDASRVAVCRDFLQKGECLQGEQCDLSHDLTVNRTPTCLHHAKGNCANPKCPYTHSEASPGAPVCRSFGLYGYCDKGAGCEDRHVFECPDFSNTGKCNIKGCKLVHRERASVLRKTTQMERAEDVEMGDVSSDNESVDSDDVDSDEVEEFFGDGLSGDADFRAQKDYISF